MPKRQTQQEFIDKSKTIFGEDTFDYSKVKYKRSVDKVILICKKHGEFIRTPAEHLSYERGCYICKGIRSDTDNFKENADEVHKGKFDYSKSVFTGCKKKLIIICKIHGEFPQTPSKHITGKQGCPDCKRSAHKSEDYFIKMGNEIHKGFYLYDKVKYVNMNTKVDIICPIHGLFQQLPVDHISCKKKCAKCHTDSTRLTKEQFVEKSVKSHLDKAYNYTNTIYVNCETKVKIECPDHGEFEQYPSAHMNGDNCPKCRGSISKKEIQWLDSLQIPENCRNVTIKSTKRRYRVDAFVSETNTVYEFHGDYWHGNPNVYDHSMFNKHNKTLFSELYKETIQRENELKELGYNMIIIWESDWQKMNSSK